MQCLSEPVEYSSKPVERTASIPPGVIDYLNEDGGVYIAWF